MPLFSSQTKHFVSHKGVFILFGTEVPTNQKFLSNGQEIPNASLYIRQYIGDTFAKSYQLKNGLWVQTLDANDLITPLETLTEMFEAIVNNIGFQNAANFARVGHLPMVSMVDDLEFQISDITHRAKLDEYYYNQDFKDNFDVAIPYSTFLTLSNDTIELYLTRFKTHLTTPPINNSVGDSYLVDAPATGAFAGQENKVATWNGSTWEFKNFNMPCHIFMYRDPKFDYVLRDPQRMWLLMKKVDYVLSLGNGTFNFVTRQYSSPQNLFYVNSVGTNSTPISFRWAASRDIYDNPSTLREIITANHQLVNDTSVLTPTQPTPNQNNIETISIPAIPYKGVEETVQYIINVTDTLKVTKSVTITFLWKANMYIGYGSTTSTSSVTTWIPLTAYHSRPTTAVVNVPNGSGYVFFRYPKKYNEVTIAQVKIITESGTIQYDINSEINNYVQIPTEMFIENTVSVEYGIIRSTSIQNVAIPKILNFIF